MARAPGSALSPVDYQSGVRATRALADGAPAFFAALEADPRYDPERFADFMRGHHLRQWFTPLVDEPGASGLLTPGILDDLRRLRRLQAGWLPILLELMQGIDREYAAAGIDHLHLKGLFLAERFYDDPRRRKQHDVDVLVAPEDFERAIAPLARVGFDMQTGANAKPLERRLAKMRRRGKARAPQTLTFVRGDGAELDLHCRLKSRTFPGIDESEVWAERQRFGALGGSFETLSDDHTLMLLLVSLCADLRRGAGKGKHFLDLYLVLREIHGATDWERFFARRAAQGLEKVCVNLLVLFLVLWECGDEFPALREALARRGASSELRDRREALAIVTRKRRSLANRMWFRRLAPGSKASYWGWRLTADLPRTLRRPFESRVSVPGS